MKTMVAKKAQGKLIRRPSRHDLRVFSNRYILEMEKQIHYRNEVFMTELLQVYKCNVCGNIVEVIHAGDGELVCCGQPMKLMKEGMSDGAMEKHVPVIEKTKRGYHVKVGSARHPMEDKHYIEWIELVPEGGNATYRRYLSPADEPEAFFDEVVADAVTARAYCNLHGLWKADNKS